MKGLLNLLLVKRSWKKAALLAAAVGGTLAAGFSFILIFPHAVFAEIQDTEMMTTVATTSGLSTDSLPILIAKIISFILGFIGIILVLILIYCGWLYMSANGVPDKIAKAHKIFRYTAVGLLLIFGSFAITVFILSKLLEAANLGGGVSTTAVNYSEPLASSLGSGIIESHYPARGATEIPRNTRIMITFKEAIDMESLIANYSDTVEAGGTTFYLNTANVLIYKTDDVDEEAGIKASDVMLTSAEVAVTFNNIDYNEDGTVDPESYTRAITEGATTFVFDPPLLGNSENDTNYTVFLNSNIQKISDGITSDAFSGSYEDGYQWSFTVSTEIDLTPPHVVSVIPVASRTEEYARNTIIQINFNEAMDPVAGTGTYHLDDPDDDTDEVKAFTNINSVDNNNDAAIIEGTYSISNSYKTIEFVSEDDCGEDPCGNTIYCLPGSADITVTAKAATLSDDPPQASTSGGLFNGLADAAGNSLDGSGPEGVYDGIAQGPDDDNYSWSFLTSETTDLTPPEISSITPNPKDNSNINIDQEILITFSRTMWSATLNSNNIQIVPNHNQSLWFVTENSTASGITSTVTEHENFWSTEYDEEGNEILYFYYPVITQGVRGSNQICMSPANGPDINGTVACASSSLPYCCDGIGSLTSCKTMGATGETAKASTTLGQ